MIAKCEDCPHEWMVLVDSPLLKPVISKSVMKRLKAQKALECEWCGGAGKIIGEDWRDNVGNMG